MLKGLTLMVATAFALPAVAADAINNENKAQHDPTLVVERLQLVQALVLDVQKPNPPVETVQKLNRNLTALQAEIKDLADQLTLCRSGKK